MTAISWEPRLGKIEEFLDDNAAPVAPADIGPGASHWLLNGAGEVAVLRFVCPCGCQSIGTVPVKTGYGGASWTWDGNRDQPTLAPSIRRISGCGWHGWLTAGIFSGQREPTNG